MTDGSSQVAEDLYPLSVDGAVTAKPSMPERCGPADFLAGEGLMKARIRSFDWSSTPVGPIGRWPQTLKTALQIALNSLYPIWLGWGWELTNFYNDPYIPILGKRDAWALGASAREIWKEIWEEHLGPQADAVLLRGEASWNDQRQMVMYRNGYAEETYFTFSFSPIQGDEGTIGGLFCACTEETEKVLGQRRLAAVRHLCAAMADAKSESAVCEVAPTALASCSSDVAFALFYLLDADGLQARLCQSTGMSRGTRFSPEVVDWDAQAEHEAPWPLHDLRSGRRVVLRDLDPALDLPGGPWPEPCTTVAVLPLAQTGHSRLRGFLVVGASPRLPFDDPYDVFFDSLARSVENALANARAYEQERTRAEALAELDRAKTTFFSNVSHEFRTPLTLMIGPLEDMLRCRTTGENLEVTRSELELVHRNALRLQRLVNSLLDFSRIESGRLRASYEATHLEQLTAELAGVFRSAIERAGLTLHVDCPPLPEPIHVDRDMWEKIVLNLLSNAFKFTFQGSICVALRCCAGRVELRVSDTGTGIAQGELPYIFKRFHRIEGARARTYEGSGIGLALVQELVQMHGGEISAESTLGKGTTFTVALPTGVGHLPQERIVAARPLAKTASAAAPFIEEAIRWLPDSMDPDAAASGSPADRVDARILIADDNADFRGYLGRILGRFWRVEAATDGEVALQMARRDPPDLVVTDVMMPCLDGFALLRELRADERTEHVPVVMLSARAGEEAKIEGLKAGADDYLIKPFSARELIARVRAQLALSAGHQERTQLLAREQLAREEAELQREHLFSLFMQTPTPIAIVRGPEFSIELANLPVCEVWGREHAEVIRRPLFEAIPELEGQVFRGLLEGVMRTGQTHIGRETPCVLRRRSGALQTVYFNFVYAPLRGVHGSIEGVLVSAFDVTQEVAARRQLEKLHGQAEAASRAKDEFLAMLGHELRNPLAPIVTALQIQRLRGGNSALQDMLERQVGHLTRLVDDLLDVSRIARGRIELRRQRIELAETVARAIETVSPLLEQRRHTLELDVPHVGLGVDVDPDRMAQVISNLLTNAAKYSEPGSRIAVSAQRLGERVRLRVQDPGVGIAPEMIEQVFDLFVQQPQTLDRSRGGLGLGLTIVRSLVQAHGGSVWAQSPGVGKGSEFTVELPALSFAPEHTQALDCKSTHKTAREAGQRILVVDDNEDAAATLKEALEQQGHQVQTAHDGPDALRVAGRFRPQLALVDIGLPIMDGYELAERLRSLSPEPLRILVVTGYGQKADKMRSERAGIEAHLVKPVDLEALQHAVNGKLGTCVESSG